MTARICKWFHVLPHEAEETDWETCERVMLMWEFVEVAEKDKVSKTERVARGQQRTRLTDDEQKFLLQMEAEAGLIAITPPEQKQPLSEEELALLRQLGVAV